MTASTISISARCGPKYRDWAIAAGLGQVAELFSLYFDDLFVALSVVKSTKNDFAAVKAGLDQFAEKSVADKATALTREFNISIPNVEIIAGLSAVRDCLVRQHGVVEESDTDQNGRLRLRWKGVQINWLGSDTQRGKPGPGALATSDKLDVKVLYKEKSFARGERIQLAPAELSDLFWSIFHLLNDINEVVSVGASDKRINNVSVEQLTLLMNCPALVGSAAIGAA